MKKQLLLALVAAMFTQSIFGYHWRVRNSTGSKIKATFKADFKGAKTEVIKPGESKQYKLSGGDGGLCLRSIHVAGMDGMALGESYDWSGSRCKSGVLEIYIPNEQSLKPLWQQYQAQTSAGTGGQAQSTTVIVGGTSGSSYVETADYLKKNVKLKGRWVN
jgi:hypothetical protein